MRFLSISRPACVAALVVLSACGGSDGGSTSPGTPPQHPYWAVRLDLTNHSASCVKAVVFERQNGANAWEKPLPIQGGARIHPGQSGETSFDYFPTTLNAQYRIQATFFSDKCAGATTVVQADSAVVKNTGVLTATLQGNAGTYTIALSFASDNGR